MRSRLHLRSYRWWGHGWTIAVSLTLYITLTAALSGDGLGPEGPDLAGRLAAAVPAALLVGLALRWWAPPASAPPGRLGRRLVLGGLALLAASQLIAVGLVWTALAASTSASDPFAQLAVVGIVVGGLCGSIARTRERGIPLGVAARQAVLVVLLLALAVFGLQAAFQAALSTIQDLPWFLLFAVLLALPGLAQLRRPLAAPAATLQVAAVLAAHAVGPAFAGYLHEDVLALVLVGIAVVLVLMHPGVTLRPEIAPRVPQVVLGAVAAVPLVVLAVRSAAETIQVGPGAAEVMTAYLVAVLACILFACLRVAGHTIPAWSAAIAVGVVGVASVIQPDAAGSWGIAWGIAAAAWAVAFILASLRLGRTEAVSADPGSPGPTSVKFRLILDGSCSVDA